jgi:hypothetical protein
MLGRSLLRIGIKDSNALSVLSSRVRDQLPEGAGPYTDGLLKFEPGDLREIRLQLPSERKPTLDVYRRAVGQLLAW